MSKNTMHRKNMNKAYFKRVWVLINIFKDLYINFCIFSIFRSIKKSARASFAIKTILVTVCIFFCLTDINFAQYET